MSKKVICPDCEMEVDKLISSSGTCLLCYKRIHNMKYEGKEYKSLVSIKGTPEYNKAMGRRIGAMKRRNTCSIEKSQTKEVKKSNIVKTKILKVEGYDYIDVNSTKILETIDYLKYCLDNVPKMEEQVTAMQEEMLLITHKKTESEGPGSPEFEKLSIREYSILKYRREIKDALVYLHKINPEILTENLIEKLEQTKENYEKDEYIPKYQSKAKQFTVSVNVSGMHGSSRIELFKRHVYANDEVEAKAYVENYLKGLSSVTIYGKSWSVREITGGQENE